MPNPPHRQVTDWDGSGVPPFDYLAHARYLLEALRSDNPVAVQTQCAKAQTHALIAIAERLDRVVELLAAEPEVPRRVDTGPWEAEQIRRARGLRRPDGELLCGHGPHPHVFEPGEMQSGPDGYGPATTCLGCAICLPDLNV